MVVQIHANLEVIENLLGECDQKWVWPVLLRDSITDYVTKMNRWNK